LTAEPGLHSLAESAETVPTTQGKSMSVELNIDTWNELHLLVRKLEQRVKKLERAVNEQKRGSDQPVKTAKNEVTRLMVRDYAFHLPLSEEGRANYDALNEDQHDELRDRLELLVRTGKLVVPFTIDDEGQPTSILEALRDILTQTNLGERSTWFELERINILGADSATPERHTVFVNGNSFYRQ